MDNKVTPVLRVVADEIEFQVLPKMNLDQSSNSINSIGVPKMVSLKSATDLALRKALFEICRMFKERDLILKVCSNPTTDS